MKTEELIAIAIAGIAVWMMASRNRAAAAPASPQKLAPSGTVFDALLNNPASYAGASSLIPNAALPGQAGYAWQYFSDGTAIDPSGNYYKNGALVWTAPKA